MLSNYKTQAVASTALTQFITKVFSWMGFGLLTSAVISYLLMQNPQTMISLTASSFIFILFIGQIFLVGALSRRLNKMSASTATSMFFIYSAINGITLTPILYMYTLSSISNVFITCSVMFGVTALYGYVTKKDLSSYGKILLMGLIGIIVSSIINIFIGSSSFDFLISILGVAIFIGLTAFDMQKIKNMFFAFNTNNPETSHKLAIYGALNLYLDFINMFLFLLRLFGRRN